LHFRGALRDFLRRESLRDTVFLVKDKSHLAAVRLHANRRDPVTLCAYRVVVLLELL
jgi:hypothetical protein